MMKKNPVTIILFGATGDLARKKVFPALCALCESGELPKGSRVVGVGRREWSDASFRSFLEESVGNTPLLSSVFYSEVEIEHRSGYDGLHGKLKALDKELGKTDWLFHLSLAPRFYEPVIKGLKKEKLLSGPRSKLLIEKPFGTDEKSAKALNALLMSFLAHEQVYRIDHYLGKEALRTLMHIHESAEWLSKLLVSKYVASIRIRLFETIGIEKRGASYDDVGAFRDVGQNHMLEALAALAVDPPKTSGAIAWHHARAKVIEAMMPPTKTCELSRRGQYEGYIKEYAIPDASKTETAFEIITSLTKGKLKGVPITLEAGKLMPSAEASIEVAFKDAMPDLRKMTIEIQPKARVRLWYDDRTEDTDLSKRDAYENVVMDAVCGDRRHFVGGKEVIAAWRYADKIVACWDKVPLESYGPSKPFIRE